MQEFIVEKRSNNGIDFYVLLFRVNHKTYEVNYTLLSKILISSESAIKNKLKKYNVSQTSTPYFMEQSDAQSSADLLNGLYMDKTLRGK